MMARLAAQHLSDQLGQQMVVENQGGAGGTIAASRHRRARTARRLHADLPVGVLGGGQRARHKNSPYDPIKDLIPVTLAGSFPLVLVTNPDLPAKDLGELIALLKANPGKYSYGSSGVGTMPHLAGELFKSMAGVDIVARSLPRQFSDHGRPAGRARRHHVRRSADPARQHPERQGARARHHHGRALAGAADGAAGRGHAAGIPFRSGLRFSRPPTRRRTLWNGSLRKPERPCRIPR